MSYCEFCQGRFPEAGCKTGNLGMCAWEEKEWKDGTEEEEDDGK